VTCVAASTRSSAWTRMQSICLHSTRKQVADRVRANYQIGVRSREMQSISSFFLRESLNNNSKGSVRSLATRSSTPGGRPSQSRTALPLKFPRCNSVGNLSCWDFYAECDVPALDEQVRAAYARVGRVPSKLTLLCFPFAILMCRPSCNASNHTRPAETNTYRVLRSQSSLKNRQLNPIHIFATRCCEAR
jgi:hypothetical protein